jgi:general secretion pathway protein H
MMPLRKAGGFTLIELMVVMVIIGITLGMVSLNALPSPRQNLENEAKRLALLLQLARDEAIVRNDQSSWDQITNDDLLRQRPFKNAPVTVLLDPPGAGTGNPMRITFGREPVDKPFIMTLIAGDNSVSVRADGIGHFTVE